MLRFLLIVFFTASLVVGGYILFWPETKPVSPYQPQSIWKIRSIDTMKYSRDLASEKLKDEGFSAVISWQVGVIAEAGATHVAIATPYDEEFVPFLIRWISTARANGLNVWFRGNLSGWEEWFGYAPITREKHIELITQFIKSHPELFQNGDIFTPCPECENGGPGDPRATGDVEGFRQFQIDEHKAVAEAFRSINKNVSINYPSMNYDVAKLVMDPATTQALGGIVGIDHYTADPDRLAQDIQEIAAMSGGKVFLGEFGVPIPDIHGQMTDQEQADWLRTALEQISYMPELIGLNYWTSVGGSTELWSSSGSPRPGLFVLSEYFHLER